MAKRGTRWAQQVDRHFACLATYGFRLHSTDDTTNWETRATFTSEVSAVAVIRSNEFRRVEVQLMRLIEGALPEYPIFVVDSVPVNTFYLDDLVLLRAAAGEQELSRQHGLSEHQIEAQLAYWAAALEQLGSDFLAGDLAVLDELERIVRARASKSPQQVTVWLPDDVPPEESASEVERVAATLPDGVEVASRRYRRDQGSGRSP